MISPRNTSKLDNREANMKNERDRGKKANQNRVKKAKCHTQQNERKAHKNEGAIKMENMSGREREGEKGEKKEEVKCGWWETFSQVK